MERLLAWLRFRGWRNSYWREDWYMATCPHKGPRYTTMSTSSANTASMAVVWTLCVDCGKPL